MPWTVLPPREQVRDEDAIAMARFIGQAFWSPNREEHNTYGKLIRAIVEDLLIHNACGIERAIGTPETQAFWLWPTPPELLHRNPSWTADKEGLEPRYYFQRTSQGTSDMVPILNKDLFLVQMESSTAELIPPSPLEIAYRLIEAFLGLNEFQNSTTTRAVREYILHIKDATQDDLAAYREYWHSEVEGSGKTPIIGGTGVAVAKLGARKDDELYLGYTELQLTLIALAFDLSKRDFNLTDHDNRSTSETSADTTFADAILPMSLLLREHFQLEVVDFYYPGFRLEVTDTEPRGEKEEAETAALLYQSNIITRNQALLRTGYDAVPDGDIYSDGTAQKEEKISRGTQRKSIRAIARQLAMF